ncbi:hypothetical protein [Acetobacter cibinongensis]|uniref:Lipoprotein n=1 Tax=Acetobacter cibinongensis TaxID=146475 RepID=A0A1Z5YXZ0_9PROT|nr:hypothetical protein [Acetobacter cibinongensis]OUJ04160.1 hypothetical protein HK14_13770 [Acetobacter cibinongensis]
MTLFSRPLRLSLTAALVLPALLAGCAGDSKPVSFAPLTYDYLGQMHLNASTLNIMDNTQTNPIAGDIGNRAPTPPAQALRQMAQDRLAAGSSNGNTAQFVIDRASILHNAGGTLAGQMDVHLDILSPGSTQTAHAEAHVTSNLRPDPSKGDVDSQANLYELTRDMMQHMNVELEYQIRHSLSAWLVDAGGTPVGAAIQTQQLGAPGTTSAAPKGLSATAVTVPATAATSTIPTSTTPENAPITTPTVTMPKVDVPDITPPQVNVPDTSGVTQKAATSVAPSEPDAIFPAGGDDDSTAKPAKTMSPKAGYLKLPGQTKSATSGN